MSGRRYQSGYDDGFQAGRWAANRELKTIERGPMEIERTKSYWMIGVFLMAALGLGGMLALEAQLADYQRQLDRGREELAEARARIAELEQRLEPVPYVLPLEAPVVSSGTGYRMDPMGGGTESLHKGIDFTEAVGTPVYAALSGVIAEHWLAPGVHGGKRYYGHPTFGGYIVIDHGRGLFTCYGHLGATEWESVVHKGYYVQAGQMIGRVGATGLATGSHLHFEMVVDPRLLLGGGLLALLAPVQPLSILEWRRARYEMNGRRS